MKTILTKEEGIYALKINRLDGSAEYWINSKLVDEKEFNARTATIGENRTERMTLRNERSE